MRKNKEVIVTTIVTENGTEHISIFPNTDEKPLNSYQIEALYTGGSYDGSIIRTANLSSAIAKLLTNRQDPPVARGLVKLLVNKEQGDFELLNGVRI